MDVLIEVNGRVRVVNVEPKDGLYEVTVDGHGRMVDAASVDDATWSLVCPGRGHQSIQAGVSETGLPGELAVHMANGVVVTRVLAGGTSRSRAGAADAGAGTGTRSVLAPMPGKIVKVLVKPGDDVRVRQGLVVVEAMKMENELRSPKDGRVADVLVTEGTSVEAGRVLVIVE